MGRMFTGALMSKPQFVLELFFLILSLCKYQTNKSEMFFKLSLNNIKIVKRSCLSVILLAFGMIWK